MSSTIDFALPDLGEGLTESELTEWHVVVGDSVELNQPIAEVETAKAIVQLPSPFAGTVSRLYVDAGSTVAVGTPILAIEVTDDAPAVPERNSVLVGYGPRIEGGERPTRKRPSLASVAAGRPVDEGETQQSGTNPSETPRATPPVRKLAHDRGLDLATIRGTGPAGLITHADVEAAASQPPAVVQPPASLRPGETRIPIKGVRKATAEAMVASAFTAPHVTEFLTIDVTPTMELIAKLRASGQSVSLLAVTAKALCIAAARTPEANSRWDEGSGEIVQLSAVNLGIAVATPRGLLVPNIRDAGSRPLNELADDISALAATARAGETSPELLRGGTVTISNVGVFGVDAGTPILNPGEAAILALGAVRRIPWNLNEQIVLRDVLTLSLSFDHRVLDGEQGSRFLTDIGRILSDPASVLTMI
jgi:pyruvate dehydrogenase E2 component (dihydrolipoamide acetyltransferase)